MGDFNKIFSIVLGLVVVVLILAIATKRFSLRNKLLFLKSKEEQTISPTPTPFNTIEISGKKSNSVKKQPPESPEMESPQRIPETGASSTILLLSFSSAAFGIFLRRKDS